MPLPKPVPTYSTSGDSRAITRSVLSILALAALSFALSRGAKAADAAPVAIPGLALDGVHTVGAAVRADALTVFPIYASVQEDLGEFLSLPAALEAGLAEVREVGGGGGGDLIPSQAQVQERRPARSTPQILGGLLGVEERNPAAEPVQVQRQAWVQTDGGGGGATVNTLVIENKGDKPILVLAGTVVKGGRQDRQIGQDFVVQAKQTVPVEAFCVEHGRWTGTRDGAATGGKFVATGTLAQAKVRSAGQYEQDQGKVWRQVAEVNAAHGKEADTGTLLATLESDDFLAKREKLARDAAAALATAPQAGDIVGLAWASGGEIRGVRWFASHGVYATFAPTLLQTAAVEGVSADAGGAAKAGALEPKDVQAFVKAFEAAKAAEVRDTGSGNVNEYFRTEKGYKSETRLKGKPGKMPLSVDML